MEKFIELFKYAYTRPKKFEGRACRAELVAFAVPYTIICFFFYFLIMLGVSIESTALTIIVGLLFVIYTIASISAGLGVIVRRFHDLNLSGWLYALNFVPILNYISSIVFFVLLFFIKGTEVDNKYGPISEKY